MMITSKSNPKIKNIVRLQKASERRTQQRTLIEGFREIERALISGWKPETLFVCHDLADQKMQTLGGLLPSECQIEAVSRDVFEHIAYREGSDGILAVCKPILKPIEDLTVGENPLVIVLESIEKPGNMGAILRTADAAAIDAVIVCEPGTDLYNPNTIRASLGCIFSVPIVACSSQQAYNWLQNKKCSIYATSLEAAEDYLLADFRGPSAIVMGTEATGLSPFWTTKSTSNIRIDMLGIADSLNVSVATAIVIFEARRQRKCKC